MESLLVLAVVDQFPVVSLQVIHKHFYLKRVEIMSQCEEWIADIQQYSSDKRVGRTMSHHAAALKVIIHLIYKGAVQGSQGCRTRYTKHW